MVGAQPGFEVPPRFVRPESSTDEGGLWSLMDREEGRLRRSPFTIRDAELRDYVQQIACKLAGDHCPDIRIYLVRTPLFNANMAPNGMMQVWSGLMLRVDNEAQLAAILGHEIGHYLAKHSTERLRDAKSRSAFGAFLGLFGAIGAIGQLGVLAGMLAYSREHEREADRIGLDLMRQAGYAPAEAAKVWGNLLLEIKAKPGPDAQRNSPLFATHPQPEERMETLSRLAASTPGGMTNDDLWHNKTAPYRLDWVDQEIKRGQHEESLALLNRLVARSPGDTAILFGRAELQRLRATANDLDAAMADYREAIRIGDEPAQVHRGLGLILRSRNQKDQAKASLLRYCELLPGAPDIAMIRNYVEELEK
jgi:beta-barrel assembly-enhancing protease